MLSSKNARMVRHEIRPMRDNKVMRRPGEESMARFLWERAGDAMVGGVIYRDRRNPRRCPVCATGLARGFVKPGTGRTFIPGESKTRSLSWTVSRSNGSGLAEERPRRGRRGSSKGMAGARSPLARDGFGKCPGACREELYFTIRPRPNPAVPRGGFWQNRPGGFAATGACN